MLGSFPSPSNTILSFTLSPGRKKESWKEEVGEGKREREKEKEERRREAKEGRWCWKSPKWLPSPAPHSKDEQTGWIESDPELESLSWHLAGIFGRAVTQRHDTGKAEGQGEKPQQISLITPILEMRKLRPWAMSSLLPHLVNKQVVIYLPVYTQDVCLRSVSFMRPGTRSCSLL